MSNWKIYKASLPANSFKEEEKPLHLDEINIFCVSYTFAGSLLVFAINAKRLWMRNDMKKCYSNMKGKIHFWYVNHRHDGGVPAKRQVVFCLPWFVRGPLSWYLFQRVKRQQFRTALSGFRPTTMLIVVFCFSEWEESDYEVQRVASAGENEIYNY